MDDNDILIDEQGNIRFVYSDLLDEVFVEDDRVTERASHVEPASSFGWEADGWLADMKPSGGPRLYDHVDERGVKHPFKTRAEALAAERAWLRKEKGL